MNKPQAAYALLAGCLAIAGQAQAAGGHHAVDDAAILDANRCQMESWVEREPGAGRSLVHLGSSCRVGALELGLSADRTHLANAGPANAGGAQLKWAYPLTGTLATGVLVSAAWQNTTPRSGGTLVLPLTWQVAGDALLLHLNVGRDFRRGAPDTPRGGAALEWAPTAAWSFVAERFRESGTTSSRAGVRYALDKAVSIDMSHTRGTSGSPLRWWTAGLTWEFDR